jgi:hypothetical protein
VVVDILAVAETGVFVAETRFLVFAVVIVCDFGVVFRWANVLDFDFVTEVFRV